MNFTKIVLCICENNFRKWSSNPRIFILPILIITFIFTPCRELANIAGDSSVTPWIFPFLYEYQFYRLFLTFGAVLLFCDAPFIDITQPYLVVRGRKLAWFTGQLLYIMMAAALYLFTIIIISIFLLFPNISFEADWGKLLYTLSKFPRTDHIDISSYIIARYTPFWAMTQTFILNWLHITFLGMLMFAVNMVLPRATGAIVCVAITLLSVAGKGVLRWILPSNLARLALLETNFSFHAPSLIYSYFYLSALIAILYIFIYYLVKKMGIEVRPSV